MKRIQIAFAALLFSTNFAMAQTGVNNHDRHSSFQHKEMAYSKQNLNDDQKVKLKTENEEFSKQMQAINSNSNQTVKQQKEAREALMKAHKEQMESILTDDQKMQLAQIKSENKKDAGEMTTKHLNKMKQELSLTDNQISQLKSSQETIRQKIEAINSNTNLDNSAKRQQLQAARKEMKNNMEQILTPEQKEKWQGMKHNRMHSNHRKDDFKSRRTQPQV